MATAIQMDGKSMTKMQPAAEVQVCVRSRYMIARVQVPKVEVMVDGCTSHEQAHAIQEMFIDWCLRSMRFHCFYLAAN